MTSALPSIAGVVVLYHPEDEVVENIRSYAGDLDLLVIVDNSRVVSPKIRDFAASSEKIVYHGNGVNHGIAAALNVGAGEAMARGYAWLLTMDQDSRFEPGSLFLLIAAAGRETRPGIVSPRHEIRGKTETADLSDRDVPYVMTSGNLLNLAAYREAGPFLEKLFIDYVDCEYCLRLRRHGRRVHVVGKAALVHSYGSILARKAFGLTFNPTRHAPFRKYYILRNRLYVWTRYPGFLRVDLWPFFKEFFKDMAFEDRRLERLRFMLRGARDFFRGRYGPLPQR